MSLCFLCYDSVKMILGSALKHLTICVILMFFKVVSYIHQENKDELIMLTLFPLRWGYLLQLLTSCGYCGPQADGGSSRSYRLRDVGGEGWSVDNNPCPSRLGVLCGSSSLHVRS